ncbi:MAG: hypothetical protein EZS28_005665 [Streblomastix strix]|uniref:Uncharacterized protein n=1 Tax=Streblomastix strix TaxID=222440 RepID=A0A5J4WV84_9EUKA|nr:MAG: hypothetical protein EZS28_005665 [Streblomastix strix]
MLAKGKKLWKGMSDAEKHAMEQEIIIADSSIRPVDAFAGEYGLKDRKARRIVFGARFPNSLLQDLYETEFRVTREDRLKQEKYVENTGRFEENINVRTDQPSMNLGSRKPIRTEEQQLNDIMNFGNPRQNQKENQQLNLLYPTESQEDFGQSSIFQNQSPEQTVTQEKITERQRQAIQKDIHKQENLNIVYGIGALNWSRLPINDIHNRNPFETHKTGYKYGVLANIQAYLKIDATVGSKKQTKMKKNFILSSQLISKSTVQDKLAQKLYGKLMKKKVKK